jgi:L-ascorbate metabolism protein UlaG (beta-lactamase superfamily)
MMSVPVFLTHSTTACMLLEIGPIRILTDPVFDLGNRRYKLGPAAWATRRIGPAIDPSNLPPLDAILLSHSHHADNLDDAGLAFVRQQHGLRPGGGTSQTKIITGHRSDDRLGEMAHSLQPWEQTSIEGADGLTVTVTAVPAKHGPWFLPESWHVTGFVLEWPGQENGALYISGDTVYFRGIKRISERFNIGTAILHMGGVHFWPPWPWFIRFTMNARQAARCARRLNPKTIIPIHYEQSVWSHFRVPLFRYKDAFADAGLTSRVLWTKPGEREKIHC